MKKGFYSAVAVAVCLALSGCGGGSDSPSTDTNPTTGTGTGTVALPAEFRGTWRQPCYEEDGEFVDAIFEFSADQLVRDERFYEDGACTVAVQRFYRIVTTFDLRVFGQTISTSYGDAYAIDFTSVAAEVDGVDFAGFVSHTEYDLLLVQGNSLLVGYDDGSNPNFGESDSDRPTEIDPEPLMVR